MLENYYTLQPKFLAPLVGFGYLTWAAFPPGLTFQL